MYILHILLRTQHFKMVHTAHSNYQLQTRFFSPESGIEGQTFFKENKQIFELQYLKKFGYEIILKLWIISCKEYVTRYVIQLQDYL